MYQVRIASLDDVDAICAVYRSDPVAGDWLRYSPGDDGRYRPEGAVPGPQALNAFEQWMNGGPWMNPHLCAIHLNALLLARHVPLVAFAGEEAVGELELFWDGVTAGPAAHIGVLQVKRSWQHRGVGRALVEAAAGVARERGCLRLTVEPAEEARGFYTRLGFLPWLSFQAVTLRTVNTRGNMPLAESALPPAATAAASAPRVIPIDPVRAGWHLVLNYRQCPAQIWHQYSRPLFALPQPFFGPHRMIKVSEDGLELLLLVVCTPAGHQLYGWSPQTYRPRHLSLAARALLAHGPAWCRTAVPAGSAREEAPPGITAEAEESYEILQLPLTNA
ncbi:MAG: GNAT family N-acetyltransferase [Firmicutes bacterium]|nr:GNAT family N-acetyltransferase [Bacillota bacterium]